MNSKTPAGRGGGASSGNDQTPSGSERLTYTVLNFGEIRLSGNSGHVTGRWRAMPGQRVRTLGRLQRAAPMGREVPAVYELLRTPCLRSSQNTPSTTFVDKGNTI